LEQAKNKKRRSDVPWFHKSLCLCHDIGPVAKKYFDEQSIPESNWKICQCGKFQSFINQCDWKYRAGLNEIIKMGAGTRKGAHYIDLNININNQLYKVNILSMQAGEIKKSTQPCTRKKRLGTGTFYDGAFIQELGVKGGKKGMDAGPYYIEWRLKKRFARNKIPIKKGETSKDVADFWYQNWSVHGLREDKNVNLNTKQFVAIHNNPFILGTSREACENRIVLYIYAGAGAPDIEVMEINGKELKTKQECEMIRKNLEEKRKKKLERKETRKRDRMCRKRRRNEMESEWMGGSESMPIKIEDDEGFYSEIELDDDYIGCGHEDVQNSNISQNSVQCLEPPLKKLKGNEYGDEVSKWKKMFEDEKAKNKILQSFIFDQNEIVKDMKLKNHKLEMKNIELSQQINNALNLASFGCTEIMEFKPEIMSNVNGKGEDSMSHLDFSGLKYIDVNLNQLSNELGMIANSIDSKVNMIGTEVCNDFASTLPELEMYEEGIEKQYVKFC